MILIVSKLDFSHIGGVEKVVEQYSNFLSKYEKINLIVFSSVKKVSINRKKIS